MTDPLQATIVARHKARYDVLFFGEVIVRGSRDPECDLARALLSKGITGNVAILNDITRKPRTFVNIEKGARLTVREIAPLGLASLNGDPCRRRLARGARVAHRRAKASPLVGKIGQYMRRSAARGRSPGSSPRSNSRTIPRLSAVSFRYCCGC